MNTTDFLTIASSIVPDRPAIIFEGKIFTFGQLNERSNRLAHALTKLGIKKGDIVAILQVNCNQYLEAYYAAAKLGVIFAPLNFRAKPDELAYMIGNAEVKVLFAGGRYLDMVNTMLPQLPTVKDCISIEGGTKFTYEDLIRSAPQDEMFTDIGDDDITILMYTSGTTGRPKGVPLRHNAFVTYVLDNVDPASPEIEERNLLTVPLYHVAGIQAMLAAIYGGRTLVLLRQFEVKEWMTTVERTRANRAMLVPTMLKRVIDDPEFSKEAELFNGSLVPDVLTLVRIMEDFRRVGSCWK
jgi:acyl-CoA synthetase (AMP-forming)/AMP-acid ligase II